MQLIVGCGPNWPKRENDIFLDCRKFFTLSEAPKFGYTDKYWAIMHLETKDGNIIAHLTPLK